jgi:hypothetical protein
VGPLQNTPASATLYETPLLALPFCNARAGERPRCRQRAGPRPITCAVPDRRRKLAGRQGRGPLARALGQRRREPMPPGRPMAAHNAWALLLAASGEPFPEGLGPATRWRLRQALKYQGLVSIRGRLERRARVQRFWALPGELRALRDSRTLVLTGSSAANDLASSLRTRSTRICPLTISTRSSESMDYKKRAALAKTT